MAMSSHNGKFFSKSRFLFWNMFWTILNRFRPKNFQSKIFVLAIFSTCDPIFRKNGCQVTMGKHFRNQDFCFKIRFGPFWINSDQKFLSLPFFRPGTPFFEKMAMSSHNGKNFEIEIFVLKYVLDHSESIPTQKKFLTKIFCLCHFFDQKWPKIEVFWGFLAEKIFFQKIFLYPLLELFITVLLSPHTYVCLLYTSPSPRD